MQNIGRHLLWALVAILGAGALALVELLTALVAERRDLEKARAREGGS